MKFVGKGKFGFVFAVKRKGETKDYALKLVQITEQNDLNDAKKEIENMEKLKNLNNILSIYDYKINEIKLTAENSTTETKFSLIEILMELADGSLEEILEDSKSIAENTLIQMFKQLVNGLSEAFDRKCGHLDIKPQNILAFGDNLKLADWGGSIFAQNQASTNLKEFAFSAGYASPEVLKNAEEANIPNSKKVSPKVNLFQADLYSLGLVILKCCGVNIRGQTKIPEQHHGEALDLLIKDALNRGYSHKLLDIVKSMCDYNPKNRIDINRLKELVQKL